MNIYIFALAFCVFLNITYWISSYEKVFNYKATLGWMQPHFANSALKNCVPLALLLLIGFEVLTAVFSALGLFYLLLYKTPEFVVYANYLNLICLFLMLIAQRLAKDFDGARTIVIYLIPSLLALLYV
ncbi:DoxX family protein [Flavobacterium agricola]|uniref:DoxX family protein n=1 Tax=Flavobacterium agricola TaxID=2870839 RepID=A0ABY6LXG5_9FLAO|nr:DoxX family protein [Flavobacterium agricola]UYW01025.1 DoxX family protein [Flavobacterium agricola]